MRQEVAHSGRLPRCSDSVRLWRHFYRDGGAGHAAQRTEHGRRGWHRHTGLRWSPIQKTVTHAAP